MVAVEDERDMFSVVLVSVSLPRLEAFSKALRKKKPGEFTAAHLLEFLDFIVRMLLASPAVDSGLVMLPALLVGSVAEIFEAARTA